MAKKVRLPRHHTPQTLLDSDGRWYAVCFTPDCGWVSPFRFTEEDAQVEADEHTVAMSIVDDREA